jgi:phage/plasmid-like protein (TIGR03299 family)
MAHGFEDNNSFFSVKKRPWHKFGTVVEEAPSIEEGIKLAGLNWNVELDDLYTPDNIKVPSKAAYRMLNDKKHILGVVGSNYRPLQNVEAFDWFQPYLESGLVSLETAGCLFSGKKVFILAKIKDANLQVCEGDEVERFILLSNSHDGTTSARVGFTPVRAVCNNTLKMAEEHELSQLIRVRHTTKILDNLQELRNIMDLVNINFKTTVEHYKCLYYTDINSADLENYVQQVFSTKSLDKMFESTEEDEKEQIEQARTRLLNRVEEIFELDPARGTLWGAYNAAQGYIQHVRGTEKTSEDSRYQNLWFGDGDRLNRKALSVALSLVD